MGVNFPYKLYQQRHRMETHGSYTNRRTQRKQMQKAGGDQSPRVTFSWKAGRWNMTIEK